MKDRIRTKINNIIEYMYDENEPMASKKFYLVVGYVLPVLVLLILFAPLARFGMPVIILECAFAVVILALTYVLYRFKEYKLVSYVLCFVTCFLILPTFYLITGYIYNGMPVMLTSALGMGKA